MFAEHQPRISAYARSSPEAMQRVIQFVILTAHRQFMLVESDMDAIEHGREEEGYGILFAWKAQAWAYAAENAELTYSYLEHVFASPDPLRARATDMLAYLITTPGLAYVKGGFVLQLCYGITGCIDTHNATMYDQDPRAWRLHNQSSLKAQRKKAGRYVDACEDLGGTEALWDNWCEHMAEDGGAAYTSAEHVSAMHCTALSI